MFKKCSKFHTKVVTSVDSLIYVPYLFFFFFSVSHDPKAQRVHWQYPLCHTVDNPGGEGCTPDGPGGPERFLSK